MASATSIASLPPATYSYLATVVLDISQSAVTILEPFVASLHQNLKARSAEGKKKAGAGKESGDDTSID